MPHKKRWTIWCSILVQRNSSNLQPVGQWPCVRVRCASVCRVQQHENIPPCVSQFPTIPIRQFALALHRWSTFSRAEISHDTTTTTTPGHNTCDVFFLFLLSVRPIFSLLLLFQILSLSLHSFSFFFFPSNENGSLLMAIERTNEHTPQTFFFSIHAGWIQQLQTREIKK